jgi:hypothetical protein
MNNKAELNVIHYFPSLRDVISINKNRPALMDEKSAGLQRIILTGGLTAGLVADNAAQRCAAEGAQRAAVGQHGAADRADARADRRVAIAIGHMPTCGNGKRRHHHHQHTCGTFNIHNEFLVNWLINGLKIIRLTRR